MTRYREIYRAEQLPVFQNRMFDTADAARACTRGDVILVQDTATGLIFNRAFDPKVMAYDADYQNEQGHSGVFRAHLQSVADVVRRHFNGRTLIEVGCGKGHFLEQLQSLGFDVTGLDPTYEGDNPAIIREYFTTAIGLRADGLVLRHVLEHVQDPVAFLGQLRDANGGRGHIYIEVPCVDWIAERRAWFDLFYEHVNYFRLDDFHRMFSRVLEAGHTFGGQYLYVVADLQSLRTPTAAAAAAFDFPQDFRTSIADSARRLKQLGPSQRSAVWGGASKGVIFSLFMQRAGASVDLLIDINPAKQGRYVGVTGLRVHAPDEAASRLEDGANVFVMNTNYLREIQALTRNRFNYITIEHERI